MTAEKKYSNNFNRWGKKFCLSLHYNGANSYLSVLQKLLNFKQRILKLVLGNISKDFSVGNMKKIGLNGYVYDFSIDYDAIAVNDILEIHKYLMKKNNII